MLRDESKFLKNSITLSVDWNLKNGGDFRKVRGINIRGNFEWK